MKQNVARTIDAGVHAPTVVATNFGVAFSTIFQQESKSYQIENLLSDGFRGHLVQVEHWPVREK